MKSGDKKNHYIPQFLLSNFQNKHKKLWVYDKLKDKIFPSGPRDVGHENHFYRIREGEMDQGLSQESYLAKIDGRCAPVVQYLVDGGKVIELTEEQRMDIYRFIACMVNRTPYRLSDHRQVCRNFAHAAAEFDSSWEWKKGNWKKFAEDPKANFVRSIPERVEIHLNQLNGRRIELIVAPSPDVFVISDTPVVLVRDNNEIPVDFIYGEIIAELPDIYVPLSPSVYLCALQNGERERTIDFNEVQAFSATRFVYSRDRNTLTKLMEINVSRLNIKFSNEVLRQLRDSDKPNG